MACLSSAPSNASIIKTAAQMASAYGAKFTALFVETPDFEKASAENKARLARNIELAKQLGAEVETVFGDDIAYQIARFSEAFAVTKLVIGRSSFTKKRALSRTDLIDRLLVYAPAVEIHIIPDRDADVRYIPKRSVSAWRDVLKNSAICAAGLGAATLASYLLTMAGFTDEGMIMVYLLAVLIISTATSNVIYSLISSVAGVFLYNGLFAVPAFSFSSYGTGYPIAFLAMFLTAFITGSLAQRNKRQANQYQNIAHRLKILFETNKLLLAETDRDKILTLTAQQLIKLFKTDVLIFDENLQCTYFAADPAKQAVYDIRSERKNAESAINGAQTDSGDSSAEAHFVYMPLNINGHIFGAVGIDSVGLSAFEHDTLTSVVLECALALENEKNMREKEQAAVMASNEQLRANILRSISHDLRTPLTSISGNAANLLENGGKLDPETRTQLLKDILKDSDWLINLTENLLASTRMEDGKLQLRLTDELIDDIVDAAVNYCRKGAEGRRISVSSDSPMAFVSVDSKLIVQVLVNLLQNAVKYTPDGSDIEVKVTSCDSKVRVSVADNGVGVAPEDKPHLFEKFYTGAGKPADSRRSLGLGLYLCKSIVEAHGGAIWFEDNLPHGAVVTFELPQKEIKINE